MGIDWGATGSMLSGIGTISGVFSIVAAAFVGRSTFKDWKAERVEERLMNLAERTFVLAHRCQNAFGLIKLGFVIEEDRPSIANRLTETVPGFGELSECQQYPKILGQAVLDRIRQFDDDWNEINALRPLLRAYFGESAERHLAVFLVLKSSIGMLAKELLTIDPSDQNRIEFLRRQIFDDGTFSLTIETAITELENVMIPKLRVWR